MIMLKRSTKLGKEDVVKCVTKEGNTLQYKLGEDHVLRNISSDGCYGAGPSYILEDVRIWYELGVREAFIAGCGRVEDKNSFEEIFINDQLIFDGKWYLEDDEWGEEHKVTLPEILKANTKSFVGHIGTVDRTGVEWGVIKSDMKSEKFINDMKENNKVCKTQFKLGAIMLKAIGFSEEKVDWLNVENPVYIIGVGNDIIFRNGEWFLK